MKLRLSILVHSLILWIIAEVLGPLSVKAAVFTPNTGIYYDSTPPAIFFDLIDNNVVAIKETKLVYKGTETETLIKNVTSMTLVPKTKSCLVSDGFTVSLLSKDDNSDQFLVSKKFSTGKASLVKSGSRVRVIPGESNHFLVSSVSKEGLIRWNYDNDKSYSQVLFSNIPQGMETRDLHVLVGTNTAISAYSTYDRLIVTDFVAMKELRRLEVPAGLLVELTKDRSLGYMVSGVEDTIHVFDYMKGDIEHTMTYPYAIQAISGVSNSNYLVVAIKSHIKIVDMTTHLNDKQANLPINFASFESSILSIKMDELQGSIYASLSNGKVFRLNYTNDARDLHCHPRCDECTQFLSPHNCKVCQSPAEKKNTECTIPTVHLKQPLAGRVNYDGLEWSKDNVKPEEKSKGFDIKKYYPYIIIGGGALMLLCTLFCCYKVCCGKSNDYEEQPSRISKIHPKYDETL